MDSQFCGAVARQPDTRHNIINIHKTRQKAHKLHANDRIMACSPSNHKSEKIFAITSV
jgi:hypothetical protein